MGLLGHNPVICQGRSVSCILSEHSTVGMVRYGNPVSYVPVVGKRHTNHEKVISVLLQWYTVGPEEGETF